MNSAVDAKVAGIMTTEENPNFVQQLMTVSKTTLSPSSEALYETPLQSLGKEQERIGRCSRLQMTADVMWLGRW